LNLARSINPVKPLILWKGGESASGAGAVASHTGTLSGEGRIWEGALKQAGITRAGSLEEVAGAAMAFLYLPPPRGRRTFILGGGGGYSVYYADICSSMGLHIPPLIGEIREKVAALIPSVGSFARNPVDAWKSFYDPDFMARILEPVFESPSLDMIILDRLIPRKTYAVPEDDGKDPAQAAIDYLRKNRYRKPLAVVVDGGGEDSFLAAEAARLRQRYCQAGIPAYSSFSKAAHALVSLAAYYEKRDALISTARVPVKDGIVDG
jgi:acyl-CoA synthetase (NDP forming)